MVFQRYNLLEQNYSNMNSKYSDVVLVKQNVEQDLFNLQASLEQEKNAHNQASEHTAELHGMFVSKIGPTSPYQSMS